MRKTIRKRTIAFECLELRAMLAEITWGGGANDDWHNGANWSTGTVPDNGDTAILQGGTIKLYANQDKIVSLEVPSGVTFLHVNSFDFVYTGLNVGSDQGAGINVYGPGRFKNPPQAQAPNIIVAGTDGALASATFNDLDDLVFL